MRSFNNQTVQANASDGDKLVFTFIGRWNDVRMVRAALGLVTDDGDTKVQRAAKMLDLLYKVEEDILRIHKPNIQILPRAEDVPKKEVKRKKWHDDAWFAALAILNVMFAVANVWEFFT